MIIEIHGAGFSNKGAELMLRAAVDELGRRLPDFKPAIDPTYGAYDSRCRLGLRQILPPRAHVGTPGFQRRFAMQKAFAAAHGGSLLRFLGIPCELYGAATLSDMRGFVDLSGFAYTDEWGAQPTQDLAALTAYYSRRGVPVILLPQAFGPFRKEETMSAFRKVLENATVVFARDQQSYDHALELAPDPAKLAKAPDITLFYPQEAVSSTEPPNNPPYACVVPNIRLLDRGTREWGEKYHSFLLRAVRELLKHSLRVRIVVHDSGSEDSALANRLCGDAASPAVSIVREEDPIALKRVIAGARLLVGSRYHSLVSALSQSVPSMAIGWSHKYDTLFDEFGLSECVFSSPDKPEETMAQCIASLADPETNAAYRRKIAPCLHDLQAANSRMWDTVADVLAGRIDKP